MSIDNLKATTEAAKETPPVQVRPTLFIAVGGTGGEICLRLRRRLLNHAWGPTGHKQRMRSLAEFRAADFIEFDLDVKEKIEDNRVKSSDLQYDLVKFADNDKLVEPLDLDEFFASEDTIGRHPLIAKWMPLTHEMVREMRVHQGAGQIRALARLYFFHKYRTLREKISAKLSLLAAGLQNNPELEKLNLRIEPNRGRIVVIGSIAGGTGSGSFLDMCYLARTVGKTHFKTCDVDLILLTPSGFVGETKDRKEANGYAALMELETLLSEGPRNFVQKWAEEDPDGDIPADPFDSIYIVETVNVAGQVTSKITDIYQMVADSLFTDFRSEDFADQKRSVAVNQRQHKMHRYSPMINKDKYGATHYSFQNAYHAFGLSVLSTGADLQEDIHQHELGAELLRAYFGVGPEYQKANAVDDRTLGDFIKAKLQLGSVPIEPPPQLERKKLSSIGSVELTRQLMIISGKKVLDVIQQQTTEKLEEVRNQFARKDWKENLRLVQRVLEQTTITDIDTRSDTNEAKLTDRATVLLRELRQGVETQLFEYIDNPDLGGLEYVLSFIEALKQKIDDSTTGYSKRLLGNEAALREWKSLLQAEIEETYSFLEQVSGNSWLGDNQKKAEAKFEHLKEDIAEHLKCHVQMFASRAAAEVLQSLSTWLGTKTVDATTLEPKWSGLAGDFQQGKAAVADMVRRLGTQIAIMKRDVSTEHAMRVSVRANVPVRFRQPDHKQLRAWADEAFSELGKTKLVFEMLKNGGDAPNLLINRVLAKAKSNLAELLEKQSLIDCLMELGEAEKQATFDRLFECAFPWVNARTPGETKNYYLYLGVKNKDRFLAEFGRNIIQSSSTAGLTLTCHVVETEDDAQATCYCELTGFPLTKLTNLKDWRRSYNKENQLKDPLPLHLHRNSVQFKHPMEPGDAELKELVKDFQIFLKAVMTGALTPRNGVYGYKHRGDRVDVGSEAKIRRDGVFDMFEEHIQAQTAAALDVEGEEAPAAMYALCEYYKSYVYPTAKITVDEETKFIKGMSTFVVDAMANGVVEAGIDGYRDRLRLYNPEHISDVLLRPENIDKWSKAIPGTENDGWKGEIRRASSEDLLNTKYPYYIKRSLRDGWQAQVARLMAEGTSVTSPGAGFGGMPPPPPPPPPLPGRMVSVAIAGEKSGPYPESTIRTMIQSGQLHPDSTHIWWPGLTAWVLIKDCPDLLAAVPPPPPPA